MIQEDSTCLEATKPVCHNYWACDFGSWWWTGKPGVLQSIGLQRVGRDWGAVLNWPLVLNIRRLLPTLELVSWPNLGVTRIREHTLRQVPTAWHWTLGAPHCPEMELHDPSQLPPPTSILSLWCNRHWTSVCFPGVQKMSLLWLWPHTEESLNNIWTYPLKSRIITDPHKLTHDDVHCGVAWKCENLKTEHPAVENWLNTGLVFP